MRFKKDKSIYIKSIDSSKTNDWNNISLKTVGL